MSMDSNIKEVYNKYIYYEKELKDLEKKIFDFESYYLDETLTSGNNKFWFIYKGNILKGWNDYLSKNSSK